MYGKDNEGCYVKWGNEGKKYHYQCSNEQSRSVALAKAKEQAKAILANKLKE
jgi:hypothetical protein